MSTFKIGDLVRTRWGNRVRVVEIRDRMPRTCDGCARRKDHNRRGSPPAKLCTGCTPEGDEGAGKWGGGEDGNVRVSLEPNTFGYPESAWFYDEDLEPVLGVAPE